jgi:2-polyprenyl-3-methyl-5-hydroxy-6-metoxy-1,4-benzoquinol methylase
VSSSDKKTVPFIDRARNSLAYRTGFRVKKRNFPRTPEKLAKSNLFNSWWYYSVELLPGLITKGIYPQNLPNLPRLMLRQVDLAGQSCLDMGSMEGLIPVLMKRGGASQVLATDAIDHCLEKLEAVQHYYAVEFEYKSVGTMYELEKKLKGRSFDLIHCSGLLYHVFSPLAILCGIRPLLKRNGLAIISTNVIVEDDYTMHFNNAGRLQEERNTFWYISVKLFDYLLRYMRLCPLSSLFIPHTTVQTDFRVVFDKPSGYLSVLCRASEDVIPTEGDVWMEDAMKSWEYPWMTDWKLAARQPPSTIGLKNEVDRRFFRADTNSLDLWEAVRKGPSLATTAIPHETHLLSLSDQI